MKKILLLTPLALTLLLSHAHAQVSLVGAELYYPYAADGADTYDNLEYTTNSNNQYYFGSLTLTPDGGTAQNTAIEFDLADGANPFTFTTSGGSFGDYAGLELFFAPTTGTGSGSFNPTDNGISADLSVTIPFDYLGGSPTYPAAGTLIQDYGPGYSTATYSGATSYTVAGKVITLSDVSASDSASGSFTINVAAAPEPSTWLLALAGLAGIAVWRRQFRKVA